MAYMEQERKCSCPFQPSTPCHEWLQMVSATIRCPLAAAPEAWVCLLGTGPCRVYNNKQPGESGRWSSSEQWGPVSFGSDPRWACNNSSPGNRADGLLATARIIASAGYFCSQWSLLFVAPLKWSRFSMPCLIFFLGPAICLRYLGIWYKKPWN